MKKVLIFIFIFIISVQICSAKDDYTLNFNGTKYHLLYSVKNKDFGGYLNEYYRQGETYNIWSDMVAVHHFPNAYSPIDRIKDFKDYLSGMNVPSSLTFDDKKNAALIDFIIIANDKMPIVLEFNIFKYEKSKKCGSIALQYVKRYSATTTMQVEQIKKDFAKNRKNLIKAVKAFNIPQIITEDIDKCISGADLNKHDLISEAADTTEQQNTTISGEDTTAASENNSMKDNDIDSSDKAVSTEDKIDTPVLDKEQENEVSEQSESDKDVKHDEAIVTEEENNTDKELIKTEENKEKEIKNEELTEEKEIKAKEESPSIPEITEEQETQTKLNKEIKQKKKLKEVNYQIKNDKDAFYAKPRTKNELKELKKQNKKELKAKNTTYVITNNNNDLIAKPRTKKEMKEYKKSLKTKYRKNNTENSI